MMTAAELRRMFIDFFKSHGHAEIKSAPLVPENDPTCLFTTAGMHPLVPFLLGEKHPAGKRLTDVQKCLRTGDIDEVGDPFHMTSMPIFWMLSTKARMSSLLKRGSMPPTQ